MVKCYSNSLVTPHVESILVTIESLTRKDSTNNNLPSPSGYADSATTQDRPLFPAASPTLPSGSNNRSVGIGVGVTFVVLALVVVGTVTAIVVLILLRQRKKKEFYFVESRSGLSTNGFTSSVSIAGL